jgi:polar amino acid transport system substrate-binding protein
MQFIRSLFYLSALFFSVFIPLNHTLANEHFKKLKVAFVEFPPMEYVGSSNKPAGVFIDITKAVLDNAGIDFEFVQLPVSRTYLYIKDGNIDLWPGLAGIPALQGYVIESHSIPVTITLSAWHLKNNTNIEGISDLTAKTVILINGYTYGGLLYKITKPEFGMTALYAPNHLSGLKMLQRGRGQYLLDYNEPIFNQLETYSVEDLSHTMLNIRDGAFIISKKTPKAQQLRQILDQSYKQLVSEGKIKPNSATNLK